MTMIRLAVEAFWALVAIGVVYAVLALVAL